LVYYISLTRALSLLRKEKRRNERTEFATNVRHTVTLVVWYRQAGQPFFNPQMLYRPRGGLKANWLPVLYFTTIAACDRLGSSSLSVMAV